MLKELSGIKEAGLHWKDSGVFGGRTGGQNVPSPSKSSVWDGVHRHGKTREGRGRTGIENALFIYYDLESTHIGKQKTPIKGGTLAHNYYKVQRVKKNDNSPQCARRKSGRRYGASN